MSKWSSWSSSTSWTQLTWEAARSTTPRSAPMRHPRQHRSHRRRRTPASSRRWRSPRRRSRLSIEPSLPPPPTDRVDPVDRVRRFHGTSAVNRTVDDLHRHASGKAHRWTATDREAPPSSRSQVDSPSHGNQQDSRCPRRWVPVGRPLRGGAQHRSVSSPRTQPRRTGTGRSAVTHLLHYVSRHPFVALRRMTLSRPAAEDYLRRPAVAP
jgi:hypothetical protein